MAKSVAGDQKCLQSIKAHDELCVCVLLLFYIRRHIANARVHTNTLVQGTGGQRLTGEETSNRGGVPAITLRLIRTRGVIRFMRACTCLRLQLKFVRQWGRGVNVYCWLSK